MKKKQVGKGKKKGVSAIRKREKAFRTTKRVIGTSQEEEEDLFGKGRV